MAQKQLRIIPLVISLLIPFIAAAIGSYFTVSSVNTWYSTLQKPFFSPPNWIFGPVWTVLYLMMGIALYVIWISKQKQKVTGIRFFAAQLVCNTAWSVLFFGLQSPLLALACIVVLWLLIFLTIKNFLAISKLAGWLLIPYLSWVSFAAVLNLSIVILNR